MTSTWQQSEMRFDGSTYEPELDKCRLTGQTLRVYNVMKDGRPRTLSEIKRDCGEHDSEAGISARLRDLRKRRFGSHTVSKCRVGGKNGLWVYELNIKK